MVKTVQVPDMDQLTQFATRYATAWSGGDPTAFAQLYAEDGSLTINDGKPSVERDVVEQPVVLGLSTPVAPMSGIHLKPVVRLI